MVADDISVLDMVEHPVFVLEPGADGLPRYTAFNAHARSILKRRREDILGLTAAELYHGRLGEIALAHHSEVLATGETKTYELLLPIAGQDRLIRTTLRPELDAAGQVTRIFGTSADISGQQIFREMQTEAETMAREMEQFISFAAHDLRTPMRHVQAVAEMLREDFQDMGDGKLELIDLLEDMGEKAMRLIGDVLAHAQASQVTETHVEFELSTLVEEIMALLDPMKRCTYSCARGRIGGDRTATQIILRNLVDNALKYAAPKGGGATTALHLDIDLSAAEGDMFQITVKDNGSGFSDPALLFLDKGDLRSDSGFGMLGIRRLIRARGGVLHVTNRSDASGAEITFSLPGTLAATVSDAPAARQPMRA